MDEVTGEQGYIDDERSCFWRWDNEYTWQSKPFKSRQMIRRESAYPQSGVSAFDSPSEVCPDDPSISDNPWFHMSHTAWMASVLLNLAKHPTHVVLDLGCTRSIGSRAAIKRFQKSALFFGITTEFCPCNMSFVFANSVTETCLESCFIHCPATHPCSARVDVLETGDVPFLFSISQKSLGTPIELDPRGDKITCPAFGLYPSPVE